MLLAVFSGQLRIDWSLSDLEKSCGMGDVKGMRELVRWGGVSMKGHGNSCGRRWEWQRFI